MRRVLRVFCIALLFFAQFNYAEAKSVNSVLASVERSTPVINQPTVTGNIFACAGSPSLSPQVQRFTITGANITSSVLTTAPAFFEISFSAGSGYTSTLNIPVAGAGGAGTVIYVRSAATAPAGYNTGEVSLTSAGAATVTVQVSGTVNAQPTVNPVPSQTYNNGDVVSAINFSGTGNTYTWTNDAPSIGFPASGSGNIAQFTATNTGSNPVVANVTVTPFSSGLAYIANSGSNTITLVNTLTKTVEGTINVGTQPYGVSVSPDGSRVYVTNIGSNDVYVINTATNTVTGRIKVGKYPFGIAISPDGKWVYVSNSNDGNVSVIDASSNKVLTTVSTGGVTAPVGMAFSPDGRWVYVADESSHSICIIDTRTNTLLPPISISGNPHGLAISPDGSRLYATDLIGTVYVINTINNSVVKKVPVGSQPSWLSITPDGNFIYVSNAASNTISVISTSNNALVSTIPVGREPEGISVSPDGSEVYVTNSGVQTLSVISTATNQVIATTNAGNAPISIGNFIKSGGCAGNSITFTIKVTAAKAAIVAGSPTGSIAACTGTPSLNPQVEQFTVSGSDLTGGITVTAPANFEVSLSAVSGFVNSLVLSQAGGTVSNTVVYVRSSAAAAAGNISGNVKLSSPGSPNVFIPVSGVINALPTVTQVADQSVFAGTPVTAINFTGTGNTYNWTNDMPGIGLAATGVGNIASFIAINNGSSPVTAKITVTPENDAIAYVPNNADGTVSVINTTTNTVLSKITVGPLPRAVTISPDGKRVFVADGGDNMVWVIDATTNTPITEFFNGTSPNSLTMSPDGSTIYVSNYGSNTVSVIDASPTSYQVKADIIVGQGSLGIIVSPDGKWVYVANQISNSVSVISTATNTVIQTISLNGTPRGVAISPDGNTIYVTNAGLNTVSVIDTKSYTITSTIPVGPNPSFIVLSPDGTTMYVGNSGSNLVSVVNVASGLLVVNIPVDAPPSGLSIGADGSRVYVVCEASNSMDVISTATNQVINSLPTGGTPIAYGNFVSPGMGCTGTPISFDITVKVPSILTATTPTGRISACAGTASANPMLQQFNLSGSNLTSGVLVSAPNNFEISLAPGNGFNNSLVLISTGSTLNSTVIYVRSVAPATTGNITGNVTIQSTGAQTIQVPVAGFITGLPSVNAVPDITANNGDKVAAINFSGGANTFTWTNDTPAIGLANSGTGDISAFTAVNTGSTPVKATVTVVPSVTAFLYSGNYLQGTVSVIDPTTDKITATIPGFAAPIGIAASNDGSLLYVVNNNTQKVSVINTSNNSLITSIQVGDSPNGVVLDASNNTVYVANGLSNSVSVINIISNQKITDIPVGAYPYGIAVSPDGSTVYVADSQSSSVSVISTAFNQVTATITVGTGPFNLNVSPDGTRVYVTNSQSNSISVIDAASNEVISTINVGTSPYDVAVSPDGSEVFVSNYLSNNVSIINTATNMVSATISTGNNPYGIAFSPDGKSVYIINSGSNTISVINTANNQPVTTFPSGLGDYSMGTLIPKGSGCPGVPTSFTIKVNPASLPTITPAVATGTILACFGSASASPQIERLTVNGTNIASSILATAPANFEISNSPTEGFTNIINVPTSGSVIYIRSAASAPVGNISGNIILTSTGAQTVKVLVSATINALPTANQLGPMVFNNGDIVPAISFTGTGNTYKWLNSTPGIGLPASGTGDIASFTAVNTGSTPIKATITVTPENAGMAYVTNSIGNTISIINTGTHQLVSALNSLSNTPYGIAISPDGKTAYIANYSSNSVTAINTATNQQTAIATVEAPIGTCVSPDNSKFYVASNSLGIVYVFDAKTNQQLTSIKVGAAPGGMAISPDGSTLYVANGFDNNISVVNTSTNTVANIITTHTSPSWMVLSPDGSLLYVTNFLSSDVWVIKTSDGSTAAIIKVGTEPQGIAISRDGSTIYVANQGDGTVSVINTATNKVAALVTVGGIPLSVCISSDGSEVYVVSNNSPVSVISTATNQVTNTIGVGANPTSYGNNFITPGGCSGPTMTFTITVDPTLVPAITVGPVSGNITACAGTTSVSPNIQQFKVSGGNLSADITATASTGFEVSLNQVNGYGNSVTLTQSGGFVNGDVVYVRSSSTALAGNNPGTVTLSSPGVTSQPITVNEVINALPTIQDVSPQVYNNGELTSGVHFSGTADTYKWFNDSPGIGLGETGTGDIQPFTAINMGTTDVNAKITVTPFSSVTGCSGTPDTFTITIHPTAPITLTATGTLLPLSTTYGSPSPSESFNVAGSGLTAGVLITQPPGFEISTDNANFSSTVTVAPDANGNISSTLVYIRLAAITPVTGSPYSGSISLTSSGAPTATIPMPASTVNPAPLTIVADNKSKTYGMDNPVLTATYNSFVNNETPAVLTTPVELSTIAVASSPVGEYPILITGGASPNYTITPLPGVLTIVPLAATIVVPNAFTPNGDGINDTWNIKFLTSYLNCLVDIYNRWGEKVYSSIGYGIPWDGTYKGTALPTGTYYYVINLKNGLKVLSGYVAIIR